MKAFLVVSSYCTKVAVEVDNLQDLYNSVKNRINWRGAEHRNVFWALAPVAEKTNINGEAGELTIFPMSKDEEVLWEECRAWA